MATGRLPDPNTAPVTAKGDLYTYSTVPAKLAVGNNGETLVADSSATTGLRWQGNYAAGVNKCLNSDFTIWQRGTSFTYTAGSVPFTSDRWQSQIGGTGGTGSVTVSREAFAVGQTDVPNNPSYYLRTTVTTLPTSGTNSDIRTKIEDVSTFANETVTVSFYAKASSSRTLEVILQQNFGSGGSSDVYTTVTMSSATVGTAWARYTGTATMPSISGKTVGSGNYIGIFVRITNPASALTWDLSNVQLERGSVASPFRTATGTLAGELAACQRYYYRNFPGAASRAIAMGYANLTTQARGLVKFPTTMRIKPSALEQSGTAADYEIQSQGTISTACSAVPAFVTATQEEGYVSFTVASGLTAGDGLALRTASVDAFLGWSAEL